MYVSDIYIYVLIRSLNSLSRFGARRGCVECLQYIYIYIGPSSTQPTSPCGCVLVWKRLRNRDTYLSIHVFAVCFVLSRFIVDFIYACVRHICICFDSLTQLAQSLRG